jgi:hypothetical protein
MTDPFDALRPVDGPVDPDPAFAAALRARVERALLWEEPMTSTLTPPRTTPRMHTLTPYLAVVGRPREHRVLRRGVRGRAPRRSPRDARRADRHVEVGIGDTVLMLADEFPEIGLRAPWAAAARASRCGWRPGTRTGSSPRRSRRAPCWSGRSPMHRTGGAAWSSTRTGTAGWSRARRRRPIPATSCTRRCGHPTRAAPGGSSTGCWAGSVRWAPRTGPRRPSCAATR